ncbi:MAG: hypothetical protein H0W72_03320 [Planctomycetes bacterium]|nr:hypothetical protein [Planctomycetota bacterium]
MRTVILLVLSTALTWAADLPWNDAQLRQIDTFAHAATHDDGMWRVRTTSYDVASEIDARFTAELACYVELFTREASGLLRLRPLARPVRAQVIVYASRESYQAALGAPVMSRGQYDWTFPREGTPRLLVRTFVKGSDRAFARFYRPILNHECTHHLLQLRAGPRKIPDLVNEGLATFLQFWDPFRDREWNLTHRRSEFISDLDRARRESRLPDLCQLANCDRWDVDGFGVQTQTRYACAESFVGFCFAAADRSTFLDHLVDASIAGDIRGVLDDQRGRETVAAWRTSIDGPHPAAPAPTIRLISTHAAHQH